MNDVSSDNLVFADEPLATNDDLSASKKQKPWKLMIIDDEASIHAVTKVVLEGFSFMERKLDIVSGFSGKEACELLDKHADTAVLLLDVVMETDRAGFDVVNYVRKKCNNKLMRIVLRTGQPGQAIENDIVTKYEISDYKEKTNFNAQKINSTMITSLRTFHEMEKLKAAPSITDASVEQIIQQKTQHLINTNDELKKKLASLGKVSTGSMSESEEKMLDIINNSESVIYFKYSDGRLIFTNSQYRRLFEIGTNSGFEKTELDLLPPSISSQIIENDNQAIQSGLCLKFKEKYQIGNDVHVYATTKIPLIDSNGVVSGLCSIATKVKDTEN